MPSAGGRPFLLFRCTGPRHSCCSRPQVCVPHLTIRILSHRLYDVARFHFSVSVYLLPGTQVIRSRCGLGTWTRVTLYRSCDTGHSQSFDFVTRPKYSDPVRFSGVCGYHRLRRTGPWLTRTQHISGEWRCPVVASAVGCRHIVMQSTEGWSTGRRCRRA
jgi:hypothetical protein